MISYRGYWKLVIEYWLNPKPSLWMWQVLHINDVRTRCLSMGINTKLRESFRRYSGECHIMKTRWFPITSWASILRELLTKIWAPVQCSHWNRTSLLRLPHPGLDNYGGAKASNSHQSRHQVTLTPPVFSFTGSLLPNMNFLKLALWKPISNMIKCGQLTAQMTLFFAKVRESVELRRRVVRRVAC